MNTACAYDLRPIIEPYSHPVEKSDYVICTHATNQMLLEISEWVDMKLPGGMVYGHPRFGKSTAIKYVSSELRNKFNGTLPVLRFSCKPHEIRTEKMFYEELLTSFGHGFPMKGNLLEKRNRLVEYMQSISLKNPHKRLVFIIDESQHLVRLHYDILIGIYNDLDEVRIKPTFVLVGQNELSARRNTYVEMKAFQIIGRFMVNFHKFKGISRPEHMQICLHAYDENSEFPAGSECSYTQFFFPVAYRHGWRLTSQTKHIWDAFNEAREKAKLQSSEIGMSHFFRAVEYVVQKCSNLVDVEPHFSMNIWREGVEKSLYAKSNDYIPKDE